MQLVSDLVVKFLIGSGGAATILYSSIGSDLPGMTKSLEIEEQENKISELDDKQKEINDNLEDAIQRMKAKEISEQQFEKLETCYNNQRDDIRAEISELRNGVAKLKRGRYLSGAILFVVIGGFFAALLTVGEAITGSTLNVQVIVSAVAMGAGWTGIIARLELQKAKPEAIAKRNEAVSDIVSTYDASIKEREEAYKKAIEEESKKRNDMVNEIMAEFESASNEYKEEISKYKKKIEAYKSTKSLLKELSSLLPREEEP
jgi:DNA repair exonuclease SbcCD ATPase subunit